MMNMFKHIELSSWAERGKMYNHFESNEYKYISKLFSDDKINNFVKMIYSKVGNNKFALNKNSLIYYDNNKLYVEVIW